MYEIRVSMVIMVVAEKSVICAVNGRTERHAAGLAETSN